MAQKQSIPTVSNGGNVKAFPPEAYVYSDDVTPEGVEFMRKRADVDVSKRRLKKIDGYGCLLEVSAH